MSWFYYGEDQVNYVKHHKKMKGVWIKPYSDSNSDIMSLIKKNNNKRWFDSVNRIVISDYDDKKGIIWLEVWCSNFLDKLRKKHRYNIFYITCKPNMFWVCEGDLGKGLK